MTSRITPLSSRPSRHHDRVAIVGCGNWGKNLVRNFNHLGVLSALCDLNPEAVAAIAAQYEGVDAVTDYQAILDNPIIAGVVLATPSITHYPLAKQALLAGKHVYVEKPAATRPEEVDELETLAAEKKLTLMVGHLLLYHPAVNRLRQLIQEDLLGDIKYIQSDRLNFNAFRQDRSVLWDLAPHDLSMMIYLLDQLPDSVVSVTGHKTGNDDKVDVGHIELSFPGGIRGHIHNSWIHPTKQVRLMIRGTRRAAVIDDTVAEKKLQIYSVEDTGFKHVVEYPDYLTIEPLKLECQHFVNAIRHGNAPRTDAQNGSDVVRILQLAEQMMDTSGAAPLLQTR